MQSKRQGNAIEFGKILQKVLRMKCRPINVIEPKIKVAMEVMCMIPANSIINVVHLGDFWWITTCTLVTKH